MLKINIKGLIIIMAGISILFYFGGLLQEPDCVASGQDICPNATPTSALLSFMLKPQEIQSNSNTALIVAAIATLGAAGAVVLGIFTRNTELAAAAPVAAILFTLLFDFTNVIKIVYSANPYIAILIFAPVMLVSVISVFDWWRGRA